MPPDNAADGPGDQLGFACTWRPEGVDAATVTASGVLGQTDVPQLQQALTEAFAHAQLVLVDLYQVTFVDSAGAQAIVDAAAHASQVGARLVALGARDTLEAALHGPDLEGPLDILDLTATGGRLSRESASAHEVDERVRPLDNPVNASVLRARAMSIAAQELWFHGDDGSVGQAWAPPSADVAVAPGSSVEVYFDDNGDVNGWRDPVSGLAINQRLFDPLTTPETGSVAACQGPCKIEWRAPAAARLTERDERCLTCSGHLALR